MSALKHPASRAGALLATLLVAAMFATGATAADKPTPTEAPKLSEKKARVAQGGTVQLAASAFTATELAKLRPDFEKLKPRKRTNAE